jgi:hypothetical protein
MVEIARDIFRILADYRLRHLVVVMVFNATFNNISAISWWSHLQQVTD